MPGGLGTAPLWDMMLHVLHGPQTRNTATSIAADGKSAEILSTQTRFRSPFVSGDSVAQGSKHSGFLQMPIAAERRRIAIKAGDDPVFHDGRLWSLKPGERTLTSERAPLKMRLKDAIKRPGVVGRVAGAAALGVAVDSAAIIGMSHYEKNKQKKQDQAQIASLQAQLRSARGMPSDAQIPGVGDADVVQIA